MTVQQLWLCNGEWDINTEIAVYDYYTADVLYSGNEHDMPDDIRKLEVRIFHSSRGVIIV